MPYIETIAVEKARIINSTPSIYGTFAEIGAGQEVVNHFFKAGQASQTVAKGMSAYDMTFSDHIYGRTDRYVSESRLFTMLDHEYELLQKRLKKKRGHNTKFFAFADTVAVSTAGKLNTSYHHGWMGIRFQSEYKAHYNEMILHINLLDKTRLQQYETLGILGVNLIYSAFYGKKDYRNIIKSLFDNFESSRVDIDVLRCSGNIFKQLNYHQLNTELIYQQSTEALLFQNKRDNILPSDALYGKHILVQQHSSKEKTLFSSDMKRVLSYIKNTIKIKNAPVSLVNIPIQYLKTRNIFYYLKKYSPISKNKNQYILISDFKKLYELKDFIRKTTDQYIFIILNKNTLRQIFNKNSSSAQSSDDILNFFSRLCDQKTILMIPGYNKLKPPIHFHYLEKYLMKTKQIVYFK